MDSVVQGGISFYMENEGQMQHAFIEVLVTDSNVTVNMYVDDELVGTADLFE